MEQSDGRNAYDRNNNAHESDSKQCSFIHEQETKQDYMNVFISSNSRLYRMFLFAVGEGAKYVVELIVVRT